MHLIGFYNYTVILTYLSLVSSMIGMLCVSRGHFPAAVCCLILSGICDMFDGIVARTKKDRTADEKNFGIQLDSLCDVVCFGVFPAVLLHFRGVNSLLGIGFLIFYVLCAVIRLAFFNVLEAKRQMTEDGCAKEYRGLPVTTSAIIFPLVFILGAFLKKKVCLILYYALPLVVGFLFILNFRVPKIDFVKLVKGEKTHQNVG
jgi:CDP-diacylglycerol--serine O-phosphatidyltransferase